MSNTKQHRRLSKDQEGMASILITMVVMIVISLLILGFASIARREQRQSLDRQLSTQAFYAAESGINDAQHVLAQASFVSNGADNTNCTQFITDNSLQQTLNGAAGVKYTCLLINQSPNNILFQDIGINSKVFPINASQSIDHIVFTWQPPKGTTATAIPANGCSNTGNFQDFPVDPNWQCTFGIARVDLVPTPATGFNRTALDTKTMTSFFVPAAAAGPISYAPNPTASSNVIYTANCQAVTVCSEQITVSSLNVGQFYMRVRMLYRTTGQFTLQAFDSSNNALPLSGAQAIIDSTGKASDVLRRIQVRADVSGHAQNINPDFAIQTQNSICKKFDIIPGNAPRADNPDAACTIP